MLGILQCSDGLSTNSIHSQSTYHSQIDREIHSHFSSLDDDLPDILSLSEVSLTGLVNRLAELNARATQAIAGGLLRPNTISLINSVSSRAHIFANNMVKIHQRTVDIATKREDQIAEVLKKMSLSDSHSPSPPSSKLYERSLRPSPSARGQRKPVERMPSLSASSASSVTAVEEEEIQRPLHVLQALQWLYIHLDNPYPSTSTKIELVRNTGASLQTINSWFVNFRRRIGWTSTLKHRFNSNRHLMVDCAHRVFVAEDPDRPVSAEVREEFYRIKARLSSIRESQGQESDLAKTVDKFVEEVVNDEPAKRGHKRKRRQSSSTESLLTSSASSTYCDNAASPIAQPLSLPMNSSPNSHDLMPVASNINYSKKQRYVRAPHRKKLVNIVNSVSSATNSSESSSMLTADLLPVFTETKVANLEGWLASTSRVSEERDTPDRPPSRMSRKRRLSSSDVDEEQPSKRVCSTLESRNLFSQPNLSSEANADCLQKLFSLDFSLPENVVVNQKVPGSISKVDTFNYAEWLDSIPPFEISVFGESRLEFGFKSSLIYW